MLGSVVVALITVSLLFVGVYLGASKGEDVPQTGEEESYTDEGFFGSLNTLVEGLQESADRGEKTKEDKYQEYLKVQTAKDEALSKIQPPRTTYKTETVITPKIQFQTTVIPTEDATPGTSSNSGDVGGDDFTDFDLGDIEDFEF